MDSSKFLEQAVLNLTYNDNKSYTPTGEYPTAFSTGYVKRENMPKNLIPTLFTSSYSPTIEKEVIATEFPNLQGDIFDVFYSGINALNLQNLHGNSVITGSAIYSYDTVTVQNNIGYMRWQPYIFGEFDPLGVPRPSIINVYVRFVGYLNGVFNNAESAVWGKEFTIPEFISFLKGETQVLVTHGNHTLDLKNLDGLTYIKDSETIGEGRHGFYFLSYEFAGFGRNTLSNDSMGYYSYALPTVGVALAQPSVTYPEATTKKPNWLLTESYGSFPYGGFHRTSWGAGIRTRPSGSSLLYGIYYEEEGTQRIFESAMVNAQYASYYTHGYIGNYTGFNATVPIVTGQSSLLRSFTDEQIDEYYSKLIETQRNIFLPEQRTDFGTTYSIVTFDDIWKHICLFPVWCLPNHQYEYAKLNENFWYAEIKDNEYMGNLVRGDDSDIRDKVPDWILQSDSTLNTYNPDEDRPKPEIDPEDPDSDKQIKPANVEGVSMSIQKNRRLTSATNFISLYNITPDQLSTLGSVLWHSIADYDPSSLDAQGNLIHNFYVRLGQDVTGTFDTSAILNYFISARIYPFAVGTLPNLSVASGNDIFIGNGKVGIPIGSTVRLMTSTIGLVDAGVVTSQPITPYNDFRDYYNTTVTAFLPYCGTVELNPAEVMNKTLHCYYAVDFYTGECTAYILVEGDIEYIVAVANGVMGVQIPLSATSQTQLEARHTMDGIDNARLISAFMRDVIHTGMSIKDRDISGLFGENGSIHGLVNDVLNAGALDAQRQSRSGVSAPYLSGGNNGTSFFMPDSAYLQIRRGTYTRPKNYGHTVGYPNTESSKLSYHSGFTICHNVDVSGLACTVEEQEEIKALLESGIYI